MESKKEDKIKEITHYLEELGEIIPATFEDYETNFEKRAACERYFEKIMEAVIDLTYFILKERKLSIPEDDGSSFMVLAREKINSRQLAQKLKCAKGMRNILAHEYGNVDNELVFEAVTEKIDKDVKEFIENI